VGLFDNLSLLRGISAETSDLHFEESRHTAPVILASRLMIRSLIRMRHQHKLIMDEFRGYACRKPLIAFVGKSV